MVSVQMPCHRRDDNREEAKLKKKEYHERKQQVGTEKLSTVTRHISPLLSNTKKEAVLETSAGPHQPPERAKRFVFFYLCFFVRGTKFPGVCKFVRVQCACEAEKEGAVCYANAVAGTV